MSKHTPGPWTINEINAACNVDPWYIFIEPNIAVIERKTDPAQDMPDARLIAAAPKLLAALKHLMVAHGEQLDYAFQQAQEAIAEAEGPADD